MFALSTYLLFLKELSEKKRNSFVLPIEAFSPYPHPLHPYSPAELGVVCCLVAQLCLCPTPCKPLYYSPPGSSVHKPFWTSLVAQTVKNLPSMQETWFLSLDPKDPLKKGIINTQAGFSWCNLENRTDPWTWVSNPRNSRVLQTFWLESIGGCFLLLLSIKGVGQGLWYLQRQKQCHSSIIIMIVIFIHVIVCSFHPFLFNAG